MTKKQADDTWSKAVKIIAGNRCEYCLGSVCLNSHHFYSRKYKSIRYDVNNGFCLCANHHMNLAHARPSDFVLWAIRKRGELWHDLLRIKSNRVKIDTTPDIVYCKQVCEKGLR